MDEKITIDWNELHNARVDEALEQQQRLRRTQDQYISAPPPEPLLRHLRRSLWYNTIFYLGFFGLVGAILGWCCGLALNLQPSLREHARELADAQREVASALQRGELSEAEAKAVQASILRSAADNPYFEVAHDSSLNPEQRRAAELKIALSQRSRDFVADMLFYGVCGLMIAMALAAAEPIVDGNYQLAAINGSLGALAGLAGGVAVSFVLNPISDAISSEPPTLLSQMLTRSATWAVLGLFLSFAPALVVRSISRLLVGVFGGIIGGAIGGLLFDPVAGMAGDPQFGRLAGMAAIGLLIGIGTGLFEKAAKTGWLKVTAGLIAGKQFILYRNPTYLGSNPQCQIYLFKDPRIGGRHAAIHTVPGGFELEDLPLGSRTLLNGKPVTRARLRDGDKVQIGSFTFRFQVKTKAAKRAPAPAVHVDSTEARTATTEARTPVCQS